MRYLTLIIIWLVVGGCVGFGIWLTKDVKCLIMLILPLIYGVDEKREKDDDEV